MSALPTPSGSRWIRTPGSHAASGPALTIQNVGPPSLRELELNLAITAAIRAAGQRT